MGEVHLVDVSPERLNPCTSNDSNYIQEHALLNKGNTRGLTGYRVVDKTITLYVLSIH